MVCTFVQLCSGLRSCWPREWSTTRTRKRERGRKKISKFPGAVYWWKHEPNQTNIINDIIGRELTATCALVSMFPLHFCVKHKWWFASENTSCCVLAGFSFFFFALVSYRSSRSTIAMILKVNKLKNIAINVFLTWRWPVDDNSCWLQSKESFDSN